MPRILLALYFIANGLWLSAQSYERYKQLPDTVLASSALGYEKKISITVPSEYQENVSEQQFPLIILFDSQNSRSYNYILNTIDYLTSNEQMPSSTIIGVTSTQQNRYRETQLIINDSLAYGQQNEDFIFDELIPLAQQHYKAGSFILLIGHSRYGYFTTYLLTRRPDILNGVISISPFLNEKNVNLVDSVAVLYTQNTINHQLYYRFGIGDDYPEDFHSMASVLQGMSGLNRYLDFNGILFEEAAHNATPGLTIGPALYDVFAYWSHQQNVFISNDNKDLDILQYLSSNIITHYGDPLNFSLGTLNGKGWYFFNEGDFEKAISAWEILMKEYPNFSEGYLYIIYAQQKLNQDVNTTLEKLKKSLMISSFYTEEEINEILLEIESIDK